MKWADLKDLFKKASKSVCTSAIVVSPDPLSHIPSTSSALKLQNTQNIILMNLIRQMKEIPKWNTPLISCTVLVMEQ
jgi:hypothetical protein